MWFLLALLLVTASPSWAGQLDASWTAPTTYTDGSPLDPAIVSYRVYWQLYPQTPCPGTQFIVTSPNTTAAHLGTLTQLMTYNVQVTAVAGGLESACSLTASAAARADDVLLAGSALQIVFASTPPPPTGPSFTTTGIVGGQIVTGTLTVQNVPTGLVSGQVFNNFSYSLVNAAGLTVYTNTEYATPYCMAGDAGAASPCYPWVSSTVPNGGYTLIITMTYIEGGQNKTTFQAYTLTVAH